MKMKQNPYRKDFKILDQLIENRPLIYFDNAATNQKPQVVIDAIKEYYETINSNKIGRASCRERV